jgi:hypothetical protein
MAKGGIRSFEELGQVVTLMLDLKQEVGGLRRRVRSKQGEEALNKLSEAIDRNLEQTNEIVGKIPPWRRSMFK